MTTVVAYCPPGKAALARLVLALADEHVDEVAEHALAEDSIIIVRHDDAPLDLPPLRLIDWTPLDWMRVPIPIVPNRPVTLLGSVS